MRSLLTKIAAAFPVVAVLAVLVTVSGLPRARSSTHATSPGPARAVPARLMPQLAPPMEAFMQNFGAMLAALGNARSKLLEKAIQEPDDLEGLQAASKAYRDSVVKLRGTIAGLAQELGHELGHEDSARLMGFIMSGAMSIGQRGLMNEFLGELNPATEEADHAKGRDDADAGGHGQAPGGLFGAEHVEHAE